ncbi:MAG: hypothetical protein B5M51_09585, partial [Anaerolinea sp. 4484_236]
RAEALTRQQKALAEEKDALHAKKEILQKQEAEIAGEIKTVRELIEPTEAALAEAEEQQKNLRISGRTALRSGAIGSYTRQRKFRDHARAHQGRYWSG